MFLTHRNISSTVYTVSCTAAVLYLFSTAAAEGWKFTTSVRALYYGAIARLGKLPHAPIGVGKAFAVSRLTVHPMDHEGTSYFCQVLGESTCLATAGGYNRKRSWSILWHPLTTDRANATAVDTVSAHTTTNRKTLTQIHAAVPTFKVPRETRNTHNITLPSLSLSPDPVWGSPREFSLPSTLHPPALHCHSSQIPPQLHSVLSPQTLCSPHQ